MLAHVDQRPARAPTRLQGGRTALLLLIHPAPGPAPLTRPGEHVSHRQAVAALVHALRQRLEDVPLRLPFEAPQEGQRCLVAQPGAGELEGD